MELSQRIRIARTVHHANLGWNIGLNDPAPEPGFDILQYWQQEFLLNRVELIEQNLGVLDDEDLAIFIHQVWVDLMTGRGWKPGEKKDPAAAPPTHPCLRDWRELPEEQQVKDIMAIAVVRSLLKAS